jgi:2-dehydro-3-deoxyphosphogluconate aldolase/(4S)-4-hydroxy-2-oxoglutarate aldolase
MDLVSELSERRVFAIVRADSAELALTCVRAITAAGITAVEISLTTPGAVDAIARARAELGESVLVGAGTVMTAEQANQVTEAGAGFVVTPADTAGGRHAAEIGLPLLCGALTPTEMVTAMVHGAQAVKLFPASLHGPAYVKELRAPFPALPLVAVGGVDAAIAPEYLRAGAIAVGVGSPLIGDAGRGGDPSAVTDRAQALLSALGRATA